MSSLSKPEVIELNYLSRSMLPGEIKDYPILHALLLRENKIYSYEENQPAVRFIREGRELIEKYEESYLYHLQSEGLV